MDIHAQPNFAEIVPAKAFAHQSADALLAYARRRRPDISPTAIQIRNTYYSDSTPVTQLTASGGKRTAKPAGEQVLLQPEHGTDSLRQTFNFVPEPAVVRKHLAEKVAIDIAVGRYFHPWYRVWWGQYARFDPDGAYSNAEIRKGLDGAAEQREKETTDVDGGRVFHE